ncbi:hypothetical protein [uncultured Sphaerochaeta sp.]|uniref:rolling circle replication-associated protein n=1 Tax=uncultured Sphaerochaeta sp. TaxID=886478 RepID=UPI002A0A85AE|nr:hypothetical protein [uncultured Sphaerochaeta sp.]
MIVKQYDLFEDSDAKKDMESVDEKSTGLSIIPYLAVSGERKEQIPFVQKPSTSWKGLNAEQIYLLKNEEKYSFRQVAERFEQRNGFPIEWHQLELRSIAYRERGEITYIAEITPNMLTIKKKMYLPPANKAYNRSTITNYSMKSRKRFFEALLTMDWELIPVDTIRELTLTYPAIYPKDGIVLKSQFDAFAKRLKRFGQEYGQIAFAWKLEFQKRGAPHFHLIIITRFPVPVENLRSWALASWPDLVAKWITSLDQYTKEEKLLAITSHKKAGIEADKVRKAKQGLVCYLAWYIGKEKGKAKEHQHVVPSEFQNVGRWWGFYGKNTGLLHFKKKMAALTEEQFLDLENRIKKTWETNGKHYKAREEKISLYSFVGNDKEIA